jgi:hypothetical protein
MTTIKKGRWQATPKTSDTVHSTPFALRLKAMALWLALYDAALLALLALILWGALR